MTSLILEHYPHPSSTREERALGLAGRRMAEELAGRTIWCAAALPSGQGARRDLRSHLGWAADEGVRSDELDAGGSEPLRRVAERLHAMLGGRRPDAGPLAPEDDDVYAAGVRDGEAQVAGRVRRDDVVVLHDPLAAALADVAREQGAHVIWYVGTADTGRSAAAEALDFVRRHTARADAYVSAGRMSLGRGGMVVARVAAHLPCADVVLAKAVPMGREAANDIGWTGVLAEVVRGDRDESVGGTLHARPAVAAR